MEEVERKNGKLSLSGSNNAKSRQSGGFCRFGILLTRDVPADAADRDRLVIGRVNVIGPDCCPLAVGYERDNFGHQRLNCRLWLGRRDRWPVGLVRKLSCTSIAQRTASTALGNSARNASPAVLKIRPKYRATKSSNTPRYDDIRRIVSSSSSDTSLL